MRDPRMKLGSCFALCLAQAIKRVASEATVSPPTALIRISVAAANKWWVSLKLGRFEAVPRTAGRDPDGSDRVP